MAATAASGTTVLTAGVNGGRFDFDDGGTYCGGWEEGKAHGHGVCTGPKGQGEYSGSWHYGFEVSGIYTWPSGSLYEGHWQNGKRHGLGVESRGKWLYRGEWTQGFKGRYGVRQSLTTPAKYEGTWANGLQDGYGSETYADGGTYQGQWLRGMRHGYGVRTSAAFGIASHSKGADGGGRRPSLSSLQQEAGMEDSGVARNAILPNGTKSVISSSGVGGGGGGEEVRGGFVLKSRSDEAPVRRRSLVERSGMKHLMQGLKIRKQRSTGDLDRKGVMASIRSTGSTSSWMSSESNYAGASVLSEGSQASFILEDEMLDANVTETYMGEWKNDKRCGFGISERSDGLKYEGEWFNNRKYGYGVTTFKDGTREEGKYKNNILITSNKKKHLFLIRSAKFRERIESAVSASQRASKIALQKADIAISRTATARGKAEQADYAAVCAKEDSTEARACAQQFAPDFVSTGGIGTLETEIPASFALPDSGGPTANNKIPTTLDIPGAGKTGPGPPSPRGVGPGPPQPLSNKVSLQNNQPPQIQQIQSDPSKPFANHVGATNSIMPNNRPANNSNIGGPAAAQSMGPTANNIKSKTSVTLPPAPSEPPAVNVNSARNSTVATPASAGLGGQKPSFSLQPPPKGGEGLSPRSSTVYPPQQQQQQPPTKSDISPRPSQIGAAAPLISAPPPRSDINKVPSFPEPAVLRQPASLQINEPPMQNRGRTPTRQERTAAAMSHNADNAMMGGGGGGQVSQAGGYNFQKIMDDRFEHYKRPPSRERSADRFGPGSRQGSRQHLAGGGRDASRDRFSGSGSATSTLQRPQSRQRTPMAGAAPPAVDNLNNTSVVVSSDQMKPSLDSLNVDGLGGGNPVTGNGNVNALVGDFRLPVEDQLRYRGVQQEIPHFGAPPKRTESLYMKPPMESQPAAFKPIGGSALQRKKSLPDVAALPTVTVKSGTQVITREEISVLSSARRELMRRQVEEAERYSANPILYIFNPQIRDWFSRQQLMLVVLFVNVTLAIMFFKLLT